MDAVYGTMRIFQIGLILLVALLMSNPTSGIAQPSQSSDDNGMTMLQDCRAALELERGAVEKTDLTKLLAQQLGAMSCLSFVRGMIAMNAMYQALVVDSEHRETTHERGLFCMPKNGVPVIEAVRILVKHLESTPVAQLEASSPRTFVVVAFANQFPCKGNRG